MSALLSEENVVTIVGFLVGTVAVAGVCMWIGIYTHGLRELRKHFSLLTSDKKFHAAMTERTQTAHPKHMRKFAKNTLVGCVILAVCWLITRDIVLLIWSINCLFLGLLLLVQSHYAEEEFQKMVERSASEPVAKLARRIILLLYVAFAVIFVSAESMHITAFLPQPFRESAAPTLVLFGIATFPAFAGGLIVAHKRFHACKRQRHKGTT